LSRNINAISQHLGISKTPLRDAIIQLEIEGFVTILPRRGVTVSKLTLKDIKDSYKIVGALEGSVILITSNPIFSSLEQSANPVMLELTGVKDGNIISLLPMVAGG
jgi:DNA-binding GntR family transcriptional regulator